MRGDLMNGIQQQGRGLVWSYGGRGAELSAAVAAVGTAFTGALGGWDEVVETLLWLIVADFILGFLAAAKHREISSERMFWGGVNKLLVLMMVAMGVRLDVALSLPEPHIRTLVCWFYLGREGLSLVENSGRLGFPWPAFVVQLLAELREKGNGLQRGEGAAHEQKNLD